MNGILSQLSQRESFSKQNEEVRRSKAISERKNSVNFGIKMKKIERISMDDHDQSDEFLEKIKENSKEHIWVWETIGLMELADTE